MVRAGKGLKGHLVPTPCHEQRHLALDQVAQSSIQPGLEHFQGGESVPVFHKPHGEEFLPNI